MVVCNIFFKFSLHDFDANNTSEGGFAPLQITGANPSLSNFCYIFLMQNCSMITIIQGA